MLERQMEELIAKFPDDFFPRKNWVLKGRQKSFPGIGRFDLLFEDNFKTQILMELKAVQAKYDDATQLARYKDALEEQGEKNLLMWLVAPRIPKSVCDFLDMIGIEYSEIHEAEFRQVATRRGIPLELEILSSELARRTLPPPGKHPRTNRYGTTTTHKVEKAWFHWTNNRGKGFFLAFVNQKGSCSIRFFDAETGTFTGREYQDGDYQDAFRDYLTQGTPMGMRHQPNLDKACNPRLPSAILDELRQQILRPPLGTTSQA